jgi:hypothetical protein
MKSHQPLRLHVPEPSARPGHETNFAYLHLAPAGAARCPPLDVKPAQTSDLAFNLVRVLDDEGQAVGPWAPKLEPDLLRKRSARHAQDARVRRAHADRAAAEETVLLHAERRARRPSAPRTRWRWPGATCVFPPTASKAC